MPEQVHEVVEEQLCAAEVQECNTAAVVGIGMVVGNIGRRWVIVWWILWLRPLHSSSSASSSCTRFPTSGVMLLGSFLQLGGFVVLVGVVCATTNITNWWICGFRLFGSRF